MGRGGRGQWPLGPALGHSWSEMTLISPSALGGTGRPKQSRDHRSPWFTCRGRSSRPERSDNGGPGPGWGRHQKGPPSSGGGGMGLEGIRRPRSWKWQRAGGGLILPQAKSLPAPLQGWPQHPPFSHPGEPQPLSRRTPAWRRPPGQPGSSRDS